jgi:hypothetical protein
MSLFQKIIGFFGFGNAVSSEKLLSGKWRSAILLGFICWSLQTASLTDEEWVGGGVEFDFEPTQVSTLNPLFRGLLSRSSTKVSTGATRFQASFSYGLDILTWVSQFQLSASQEVTVAKIQFDLLAFIRNCIADISQGGNQFKELSQVDISKLASTRDLLTTGIVLQSISLLLLLLVLACYKIPLFGTYALSKFHLIVKVFAPLGCFLHFVGICNFAGSGLLKAFCDAFDPDPTLGFLPCGYGAGYDTGAVAIPLMILFSVSCFYFIPWNDVEDVSNTSENSSSTLKTSQYEAISSQGSVSSTASESSFTGGFQSSL